MGITARSWRKRNNWREVDKIFPRSIGSGFAVNHRPCRQYILLALSFALVQWLLSFQSISIGVTALSGTAKIDAHRNGNKNNCCELSINEAHEKFEAWKTANPNTNTIKEFIVKEEDLNDNSMDERSSRMSHFAAKIFSDSLQTSNAANLACRSGKLMLNRTKVSGGRRVEPGDIIAYLNDKSDRRTTVPDDPKRAERFCASRTRLLKTLGDGGLSHSPLRVLYEDNCMAIVCKPAGIHTMSWSGSLGKSLCLDEILPLVLTPPVMDELEDDDDEPLPAPLPRHRLDQRVAGPVVVAKTRKACVEIGRSFEEKTVIKEYRAIVVGEINAETLAKNKDQIIIDNSSTSSSSQTSETTTPLSFTIHSDVDDKPSETDVVVLGTTPCNVNGVLTDLKLFPKTGRRHQLRIHSAKVLGTPILGDDLYWGEQQEGVTVRRRQGLYLYCKKVTLGHPLGSEKAVAAEISEPLRYTRTKEKALKGFQWSRAEAEAESTASGKTGNQQK
mmetsp:Transcript_25704/g.56367  ORF Transcript_25704/g.56367 Transcript_25704/m.56367 type:complete len:501 (-) Transcript_25704:111-1613(-)|eukprot:CAMPEP_0168166178 /NCGR_PEP_ID=MMETSP0139_2-20121125/1881_1 /TAXON_ID=44445 /ORGANISM="Pseudo-nitzschia australis, Strain 10249 10 AB" /LENGTH=500 /DNA_ID=CAMNT_0008083343 /DNA_START=46 /DNA_END=1548 /DNA_ORIENTATION=+